MNSIYLNNTFQIIYNIPKRCKFINIQSQSLKYMPIFKVKHPSAHFLIGNLQGNQLNLYQNLEKSCKSIHIEYLVKKIQRWYKARRLRRLDIPKIICYYLYGYY
jgi:hypothetical protein